MNLPDEIISMIISQANIDTKIKLGDAIPSFRTEIRRNMKPTVEYDANGDKIKRWVRGKEKVVITYYGDTKSIKSESWYKNDKLSREDGPAVIKFYRNGNRYYEMWYKNGKRNRDGAPAVIYWFGNGNEHIERWYKDGRQDRKDGPAETQWNIYG